MDPYQSFDGVSTQGTHAVAVTPSDTVDLPDIPKALYVGGGGDITMIGRNAPSASNPVLFKNVAPGSIIPFRPRLIMATGTTATNIVALY